MIRNQVPAPRRTDLTPVAAGVITAAHDAIRQLSVDAPRLARWAELIGERLEAGGMVLTAGNGGSATHAAHLVGELVGRFRRERTALRATCLTADGSTLTALSNDYGFERVFARQIEATARPGDVVVLFSTSGRSRNVLAATESARACGAVTLAFTGPAPNPLHQLADDALASCGSDTAAIQDSHHVALHALCAALDEVVAPATAAMAALRVVP